LTAGTHDVGQGAGIIRRHRISIGSLWRKAAGLVTLAKAIHVLQLRKA
jgi:hypothetical protein